MEHPYRSASVTAIRRLTESLWTMRVRPERPLSYIPGQYATLGLADGDRVVARPYSIVSAPSEEELEFFLEEVPGGRLSGRLAALERGGSVLLGTAAKGRFVLPAMEPELDYLLVATVTGVAPFVSAIRHLRADERRVGRGARMLLLHGASRTAELGYAEELRAVDRPWLRYVPTLSRASEEGDWIGERGRCEDVLRKLTDGSERFPARTLAYLCGNPRMVENARAILRRAGVPERQVREERYWTVRDRGAGADGVTGGPRPGR